MPAFTELQQLLPLLDVHTDDDPERDRILEVARDQLVRYGYERFSTDRLARDARVSRQTVYRRCGRKTDIFDATVRSEVLDVVRQLLPLIHLEDEVERFVRVWAETIHALDRNELARSLREHDPDFMTQLWASLTGTTADLIRQAFATIVPGDAPEAVTEIIVRLVVSLYIQPTPLVPLDNQDSVESFVRVYLLPLAVQSALRHTGS